MLEVFLSGRYYGEGYERGDVFRYIAIAEFMEHALPGCSVYYGGDSSGVVAELFGATEREQLKQYAFENGHDPYTRAFTKSDWTTTPVCKLCKIPMRQYGFGKDYATFSCAGCGHSVQTRDGGATFTKAKRL